MSETSTTSGAVTDAEFPRATDGLSLELSGGVLSITLNRPHKLNALTPDMLVGIADALGLAAADERVKVLALRGAGRGFSAGADIGTDSIEAPAASPGEVMEAVSTAIRGIVTLPHPVVAIVPGPAAGLGASLALACDVVIASQAAYFVLAFTKMGLMPDGGASALLPAAVGRARAMRMALLAERVSAQDALDWGLITAVYPEDSFDTEVQTLLARLAAGPAVALGKTKQAINAATLAAIDSALELEKRGQSQLLRSEEFAQRVAAFQSLR